MASSKSADRKSTPRKDSGRSPGKGQSSAQSSSASKVPVGSKLPIVLEVNGREYEVFVEPRYTLLYVLRDLLGLTGTKKVCDNGECGACTVIIDGKTVYSCLTLAIACEGKKILTIEGISLEGELHPIQQAFIEEDGYQCGFCTPGQILSIKVLLDTVPDPTPEQIRRGVSGNLCRCGAYPKIVKAAQRAVTASAAALSKDAATDRTGRGGNRG